jgi:hypothetical protein
MTLVSEPLMADLVTLGSAADTYLRDATPRGGLAFMDVRGGNVDFRSYLRFDLSSLGAGSTINGASLTLTISGGASRNDVLVNGRFSLYGLNNVAGNTPQNWDEATFVPVTKGTEDVITLTGVTDLDDNVAGISELITPGAPDAAAPGTKITISGAPLFTFLQNRLNDGGLATFILSNDDATDRGFGFATKENLNALFHPALAIDFTAAAIPEPSAFWFGLLACGVAVAGWSFAARSRTAIGDEME